LHKKPPRNDVIPACAGMTSDLGNFLSLASTQEPFPHFTRKNQISLTFEILKSPSTFCSGIAKPWLKNLWKRGKVERIFLKFLRDEAFLAKPRYKVNPQMWKCSAPTISNTQKCYRDFNSPQAIHSFPACETDAAFISPF